MGESNDEIARRVLASVLERLEAGSALRLQLSAESTEEQISQPVEPLVVVVFGQGSRSEAPLARATNGSQAIQGTASHPGLEKFELPKTSSNASAPKTCFMEPDRPCVNSGACQTRGY